MASKDADLSTLLQTAVDAGSDDRHRMLAMIAVYDQLQPDTDGRLSDEQHCSLGVFWSSCAERFASPTATLTDLAVPLKALCFLMDRLVLSTAIRAHLLADVRFHASLQRMFVGEEDAMCQKYTVHILRKLFASSISNNGGNASWSTFFVINDTLNDKEIHLILPALDFLYQLADLPFGWRWVLITKALQTTNNSILLKVIEFTIELDDPTDLLEHEHSGHLFRPVFVNALNTTALFSDPVDRLYAKQLRTFMYATCGEGNDEYGSGGGIDAYLRLVCSINWLVLPLYHISLVVGPIIVQHVHRGHLSAFVARIGVQPNVSVRNKILLNLKNQYVETLSSDDELEQFGSATDMMFVGRMVTDLYVSQIKLCDLMLQLRYFDRHQTIGAADVPAHLHSNEHLDAIHQELCQIIRPLWTSAQQPLADGWQTRLRESLSRDAFVWAQYIGLDVDTGSPDLRLLESEFLVRSPYYANRKLAVMALGLVRMLQDDEQAHEFVLRLCEDHTRLAVLVAFCTIKAAAVDARMLDAIWTALLRDTSAGHDLPSFVTLLDDGGRTKNLDEGLRLEYYGRIAAFAAERPKWWYTVSCHMSKSTAFAAYMVRKEQLIFDMLKFGSKMVGDQIAEYNLLEVLYDPSMPRECNSTTDMRYNTLVCVLRDYRIACSPPSSDQSSAERMPRYTRLRVNCLTEIAAIYRAKPRHYGNSQTHRLIFRLLQVVASMAHIDHQWLPDYETLLLQHNHQPSVAHLLELLVARTAFAPKLESMLCEASTPNSRRSVIVCMYHMQRRLQQQLSVVQAFVTALMPWTMGKDYATRLLAQFVSVRMLRDRIGDLPEFHIFMKTCEMSLRSADHHCDYTRLCADYRFSVEPSDLLAPVLVMYDVPRLSGMCSSECVPLHRFSGTERVKSLSHSFEVPISKAENRLLRTTPVELIVDNVQRKIVPLRQLFPEWQQLEHDGEAMVGRELLGERQSAGGGGVAEVSRGGLVVVASLLSKEANLGGLARTCEIFGAKELVLANLKVIESREFQALSMTAEKWLVSTEVKPFHLVDYLRTMRHRGYTLIGAEQTAKGVSISDFQFPEKSLLLLGNEKQGIPADLLTLLDAAVEVPQLGIVRSLNVHVTGALFVWEYAKQHSLAVLPQ